MNLQLESRELNLSEKDGLIYFSVTSDGTTGPEWIDRLKKKGFHMESWVKDLLGIKNLRPTTGVTYDVVILRGKLLDDISNANIFSKANSHGLSRSNTESLCLIRDKFSDDDLEDLGLRFVVSISRNVLGHENYPELNFAGRHDIGRWMICDGRDTSFARGCGFIFVK
jgi:hypothetical protein